MDDTEEFVDALSFSPEYQRKGHARRLSSGGTPRERANSLTQAQLQLHSPRNSSSPALTRSASAIGLKDADAIKVYIRCRPLRKKEAEEEEWAISKNTLIPLDLSVGRRDRR